MRPVSAIVAKRGESARPTIRPVPFPFCGRRRQGGGQSFRRTSSRSAFTLVELLATLFILGVIVTITGVLLRETRLTASRLSENEEGSHSASRALELIRRDLEHAIADSAFSNFVFVAVNAPCDTGVLWTDDITAPPASPAPLYPAGTNGARLCMLVLNERAEASSSNRALSEVFYYLACTPTSACASLVRTEIKLDSSSHPGAYTNPLWYIESTTNIAPPEIVARYVTSFSNSCTRWDGAAVSDWTSNELPVSVDLCLSYLPESAARRLHARGALTNREEVAKALTTVSCRVFLPNRRGYMDGK